MLKDRIVRVRLNKSYQKQRPLSYVGKCTNFNNYWVVIDGRSCMVTRSQPNGVQLDAKSTIHVVPRNNIESIRVLPDDFDIKNIQISTEGQQLVFVVKNGQPCFIGEIGEG
ncbi:MAG: hypothetical protein KAH38_03585 [Candidatus Hydrogenedentes bacterium]|nr:hypothetical protein [Candidatus Hydrogenedentota bacterium]